MKTYQQIKKAVESKGYVWFDNNQDFNLNIVGIRKTVKNDVITDLFDDTMVVCFKENGIEKIVEFAITTDPGLRGSNEYHNPKGVGRLIENQLRGFWALGLHHGQKALVQIGQCKVIRDSNKNGLFDGKLIDFGLGINCHRAADGIISPKVANWSEGCQVHADENRFEKEFIPLCEKAAELHGNSFTYTLLKDTDIK